jgi:hypothetical protein
MRVSQVEEEELLRIYEPAKKREAGKDKGA